MLAEIERHQRLGDAGAIAVAVAKTHPTFTLVPSAGSFELAISTNDPQAVARELLGKGARDVRQGGDTVTGLTFPSHWASAAKP